MPKASSGAKSKKKPAANQTNQPTFGQAVQAGLLPGIVNALEGGSGLQTAGSPSPGGGGTEGGTGGTGSPVDYSNLFAAFGMPPDMIKQINDLMAKLISTGMNTDDVYNTIVGEIRGGQIGSNFKDGLSWYQSTYAGIQYGMATGLLDSSNPEATYRDYVNKVNNYFKEFMGRDATTAEIVNYLQGGVDAGVVGAQLKGQSYANAFANSDSNSMGYSWNALLGAFGNLPGGASQLTSEQATALGEAQTGYSTPLGDQLSKQLATATARLHTIFQGTLATPADLQKTGAGLRAPSLAPNNANDTAAI